MSHLVRLHDSARPVRRGPGQVQFGLSPGHGIVLDGLSDAEVDLLLVLGATGGTARLESLASRFGVSEDRVNDLLTALRDGGLLVDPARSRPDRSGRTVCVPGEGNVVEQLRSALTREGVGTVHPRPGGTSGGTDLAVLVAQSVVPEEHGRSWQQAGTAHLPVALHDGGLTLGPLVRPGHTPCLRCLDLHRSDRDRAWPTIVTQLPSAPADRGPTVHRPGPFAATAAALVSLLVLTLLDALPIPPPRTGQSWQVDLPWPEVSTRVWAMHPRCSCVTGPRSPW